MIQRRMPQDLYDILKILRASLSEESLDDIDILDWRSIYDIARQQGVIGILFRGIQKIEESRRPPETMYLQMMGMSAKIQQKNHDYLRKVTELTDLFASEGIRTVAVKGLVCQQYYPTDCNRYSGDFDCYLCGDFEKGNLLAQRVADSYDPCYYKHSEFVYKNISVENHKFFLNIRGREDLKELERHLKLLIEEVPVAKRHYYPETQIEMPCADFNALFLMVHSFSHFLDEGVNLKQICDWAVFLQNEQDRVDWDSFNKWMIFVGMDTFAYTMNAIVRDYLGVKITNDSIIYDDKYANRILMDAVFESKSLHNQGYGHVRKLFEIARANVRERWKYREIYHRNFFAELSRSIWAFFAERNPRINKS